jgi:hypothetical protein
MDSSALIALLKEKIQSQAAELAVFRSQETGAPAANGAREDTNADVSDCRGVV